MKFNRPTISVLLIATAAAMLACLYLSYAFLDDQRAAMLGERDELQRCQHIAGAIVRMRSESGGKGETVNARGTRRTSSATAGAGDVNGAQMGLDDDTDAAARAGNSVVSRINGAAATAGNSVVARINDAAATAGLAAGSVEAIEPGPVRASNARGVLEKPTRVAIHHATLKQLTGFLGRLDRPRQSTTFENLHLSASDTGGAGGADGADAADAWNLDATLVYAYPAGEKDAIPATRVP